MIADVVEPPIEVVELLDEATEVEPELDEGTIVAVVEEVVGLVELGTELEGEEVTADAVEPPGEVIELLDEGTTIVVIEEVLGLVD